MPSSSPEFTAVILAATVGAKLYPMTSAATPKHLLPVVGTPVIVRLLQTVAASGFLECVVALAHGDDRTLALLKQELGDQTSHHVYRYQDTMKVTIHVLTEDCNGSAEALEQLDGAIPSESNAVVLPGDLVVFETEVLTKLVNDHRQSNRQETVSTPCTILLADVGEQDEHGVPLKESSKAKMGGLAREDEHIEYIALAYRPSLPPRVVWKESKIDVEDDERWVGKAPKLVLPKRRLRGSSHVSVSTNWNDLQVYVLSPWVRRCLKERNSLSIKDDGVLLWISRQFEGVRKTFGSRVEDSVVQQILASFPQVSSSPTPPVSTSEYAVRAHILDGWKAVRACTIPSYMYACKELVTYAVEGNESNPGSALPPNTKVRKSDQAVLLEDATAGKKGNMKASVIGRRSKIGYGCNVKNVVVMDDVNVHDGCKLTNCILGVGCTIEEKCNLTDCQVTPGKVVPAGTKTEGEALMDDDV